MAQAQAGEVLEILIMQGDGATNLVNHHKHEQPVIEVRRAGRPVRDASVDLVLPESGPGGFFVQTDHRKAHKLTARTNRKGRVTIRNFQPNQELGTFQIAVSVAHQGVTASTVIRQTNASSKTAQRQARARRNNALFYAAVFGALAVLLIWVGCCAPRR